jgi:hypothetical protein
MLEDGIKNRSAVTVRHSDIDFVKSMAPPMKRFPMLGTDFQGLDGQDYGHRPD